MSRFNYNLAELENMLPFEREIYVALLIQQIQKDNEKNQQG
jgi:hypothetical protein